MNPRLAESSDALDRIADDTEPSVAPVGRLAPLIIGSALFMQTLDATVISNALPTMARSLHEDPLTLNLAITSYLLASAVFLPISGWAADRFGAKLVFRIAIVLFAFSSFLCGVSQNLGELIGARMLQGMAGAMMTPVGRLVLLRSVPKHELVRAMSYLTMPAMLGPVLGPPVGGFIVTHFSWRWIFFINIPMGILGVVLVSLFIRNIREEDTTPLDWPGFFLTGFGLAGIVYGFENLGRGKLPMAAVAAMLLGGMACLAAYAFHAKRTAHPILDLTVLKVRTFGASLIGGAFMRMGMGALPFCLAMLLQMGFGMDALGAGLLTFTSAAGALVMKTTARQIISWFGFKRVLVANQVITGVILMGYALFRINTPNLLIIAVLLVGGFFRSLQFTALNTLAFADIDQPRMSRASSLSSMGQQLSQSIGIGLAAMLLTLLKTLHGSTTLQAA
ncbi:MAG TPA: DHA2 family efflux MFS transporter permease subunit, partial [Caulobacteraceae bacterium]|nr:DHA2 family efflux MFS transporter permease subunit [Caulobacteraceae bacterium]